MSDLGFAPPRSTRRAYVPDAELSDMAAFCGSDGFSVRGVPVPAEPLAADRKYGLEPAIDRARYTRLPGVRLRGTTPDPLDEPGAKPGRCSDILYRDASGNPVAFPVVSNFSEEQRREATDAMLRRYLAEPGVILYDGPNGRLERRGRLHVMYRTCRGCGEEFMKWRFSWQSQKWGWHCSSECRAEAKRRYNRERRANTPNKERVIPDHRYARECAHCGSAYTVIVPAGTFQRVGKYCSDTCRAEAKRKADRERMRRKRAA